MIERRVEEAIEIEQQIMSGVDFERTEALDPDALLKKVQKFCSENAADSPDMVMRILTLLISHYEVPEKTFQELFKKIKNSHHYAAALQMARSTVLNFGDEDGQ